MGIWGAAAPAGGTAWCIFRRHYNSLVYWPWVFLINVPIGIAVLSDVPKLIPQGERKKGNVDYLGAISITVSLALSIFNCYC